MGRLRHLASGREHLLSAHHLVGRAPACQLRVNDPGISGVHAELMWNGQAWCLQDLGSRNGTSVGGRTLDKGERVQLAGGDEVVFASGVRFELIDASPPRLMAISSDGQTRVGDDELLALPDDEEPVLTLYRDLDGQWMVESDEGTRPLQDAETLSVGGRLWQILLPSSIAATSEIGSDGLLRDHVLRFRVSRNGEHVDLSLVGGGREQPLESRTHQFLLLELARERLRDADNPDLPESEQGWVYRDELAERLDVPASRVHLWIHRIRKQLGASGVRDAAAIVERRTGAAQLRIGTRRVEVHES